MGGFVRIEHDGQLMHEGDYWNFGHLRVLIRVFAREGSIVTVSPNLEERRR